MSGEPSLRDFDLTLEDLDVIQVAKARSDALAFRVAIAVFAFAVIWTGKHVHEASGELGLSLLAGFLAGGALGLFANLPLVVAWDFLWNATHEDVARRSQRYARYLAARDAYVLEEARRYREFMDGLTRMPEEPCAASAPVAAPSAPSSARPE